MEFVVFLAFPDKFRAAAVPAGVHISLAGHAVFHVCSFAVVGLVLVFAGATGVYLGPAACGKVAPFAAFHALLGFMFEFLGEAAGTANINAVFQ